jgi:hypothetical protein
MPRGKVKKSVALNPMPRINPNFGPKYKSLLIFLGVLGVLGIYWYKTNNWPVAALVNGRPIYRFELHRDLETKYAKAQIDDMTTRKLIFQELDKRKVKADPAQVELRYDEIRKRFATQEKFDEALAKDGLTLAELKKRLSMQIALESMVEPTTDSAKLQKQVMEIVNKWKAQASIWTVFGK